MSLNSFPDGYMTSSVIESNIKKYVNYIVIRRN